MSAKKTKINRAVFLDRDGTIIEERNYPSHPDQVKLLPGAAAAIARLRQAGFLCVVVTNQSGVGRGLLTEAQMHAVNDEMQRQLGAAGTQLDGIFYCTVAPLNDDPTLIEHPDRKPGPGMLHQAARELSLDLATSWIVGDSIRDVLAGRNAGCPGQILVRSGNIITDNALLLGKTVLIADDLAAAADHILKADTSVAGPC